MTAARHVTVAILGQYKSGTTALYSRVRDAVPGSPRLLHEVDDYLPAPDDASRWVVAKVILGMPDAGSRVNYDTFRRFDRQLYLVRDPRDWLISGVLFLTQQLRSVYGDRAHLDRVLALIREKEASPARVSVLTLLRTIVEREPGESIDRLVGWMGCQHDWLIGFEDSLGDHARVRYEEMVAGRLDSAEAHLGFTLPRDAALAPEHQHVPRTRGAGQWRHWLTAADVDHFRPVFASYMRHYGYTDDWDLADAPSIDPAHGSAWVVRVTGRRCAAEGLDPS